MTYLLVMAIGGMVGFSELVSRYRDRPSAVLLAGSAWNYIVLNALASAATLRIADTFQWDFGFQRPEQRSAAAVLACSFGAMAIIRTSVANVQISGTETPIGFAAVLNAFLSAADRGVDRARSAQRLREVEKIMDGVQFDLAKVVLPSTVLASMQNATAEEAENLKSTVSALEGGSLDNFGQCMNLGLALLNLTGPKGLRQAVESLRSQISNVPRGGVGTQPSAQT